MCLWSKWMRRRLSLLAVAISAPLFSLVSLAQSTIKQVIPLNSGWEFRQMAQTVSADAPVWRPAQVPGDVHLDLLRNKLIPDPFYRDNEAKLQWIENADWEYRTTMQTSPELLSHKNIELVF